MHPIDAVGTIHLDERQVRPLFPAEDDGMSKGCLE